MTMPVNEEQLAAELKNLRESLMDFRGEMRATLGGFVRSDVYAAQQETLRAQLAAQSAQMQGELMELRAAVKRLEEDKRQNRGLVWGALGSAAVAIALTLFKDG